MLPRSYAVAAGILMLTGSLGGCGGAEDRDAAMLAALVNGLVAHWPFEEDTTDTAPGGVSRDDGMLIGTARLVPGEGVDGGGALALDGANGYVAVDVTDRPDLMGLTKRRTVAVWFRSSEVNPARRQVLYEEGGEDRGINLYLQGGQVIAGGWNKPNHQSHWTGTFLRSRRLLRADGSYDNRWHHVAVVLDGSERVRNGAFTLYLDGKRVASGHGSQLWNHGDPAGIGAANEWTHYSGGSTNVSGANVLRGLLDDLRVYDRPLDPDEIAFLAGASREDDDGEEEGAGAGGTEGGGNGNGEDSYVIPPDAVWLHPGTNINQAIRRQQYSNKRVFVISGRHRRQTIEPPRDNMTFVGEDDHAQLDGQDAVAYAFRGNRKNITIRNLEIHHYRSSDYHGAISAYVNERNAPTGWIMDGLYVHHNRGIGISIGNNTIVRNSRIEKNGILGIGGRYHQGGLIEDNLISGNNWRYGTAGAPSRGAHGGGIKTFVSKNLVIRNNLFEDNIGDGVWCDGGCSNWTVEGNVLNRHYKRPGSAIHYEISRSATIRNNTIDGCGQGEGPKWMWGAGILISSAGGLADAPIRISGNTIKNCERGISVIEQRHHCRAQEGPNCNRNTSRRDIFNKEVEVNHVIVENNTMHSITLTDNLQTGVVSDFNNAIFGKHFVFRHNSYRGRAPKFHWLNRIRSLEEWKNFGFVSGESHQP